MMSVVMDWLSRTYWMVTVVPGGLLSDASCSWSALTTGCPAKVVMMSLRRRFARAAGPSAVTPVMYSPLGVSVLLGPRTGTTLSPKSPCTIFPSLMRLSATRLAVGAGTANPSPMLPATGCPRESLAVAPAVGTPMRSPLQSASMPPLLPGLIDASVWMADTRRAVVSLSDGTRTLRPRPLTTPDVKVSVRPSGAPMAKTCAPIAGTVPNRTGWTGSRGDTLTTARSVWGSRPTSVAGSSSPLGRRTVTVPPATAEEMTWLFVRMCPSVSRNSPDPLLTLPAPLLTNRVTTEGIVLAATSVAAQVAAEPPAPDEGL